MALPSVREHGSDEDERGPADMRLHWEPVLEPGTDTGDSRSSVTPVKEGKMDWKDCTLWLLRLATAGILLVGVLLGLAISKIF